MSSFSRLRNVMAISLLAVMTARADESAEKGAPQDQSRKNPAQAVVDANTGQRDSPALITLKRSTHLSNTPSATDGGEDNTDSETGKSGCRLLDNKVCNLLLKNETGGFLTGLAMTTGGTVWALNRLQEALDDLKGDGQLDPIGGGYIFLFTFLLIVGPTLLAHTVFQKFAPQGKSSFYWTALGLTAFAGLAGGLGVSFHATQDLPAMFSMYGAALLAVAMAVYLFVRASRQANNQVEPLGVGAMAGHAFGFMCFVGGFGYLSYNMTETLADVHESSLGEVSTPIVWFLLMVGFTWFVKAFMSHETMSLKQFGVVTLVAGAASGFFAGGMELVSAGSLLGGIGCFAGFAVIAIIITMARFNCLASLGKKLGLQAPADAN